MFQHNGGFTTLQAAVMRRTPQEPRCSETKTLLQLLTLSQITRIKKVCKCLMINIDHPAVKEHFSNFWESFQRGSEPEDASFTARQPPIVMLSMPRPVRARHSEHYKDSAET